MGSAGVNDPGIGGTGGSGVYGGRRGSGEAEAVIMPRLDMTTEEMTILRWMKGEGEHVDKGEALLEVMTEKIAIEVEAPVSGYVQDIRYGVDEVVPVGEVIAYIATEAGAPVPGEPVPAGRRLANNFGAVRAAPIVRRLAAELGVDLQRVAGSGPGGRVLAADVRAAAAHTRTVAADVRPVVAATGSDVGGETEGVPVLGTGTEPDRSVAALSLTETGTGTGAGEVADAGGAAEARVHDGTIIETRLTPTRRAIARRMEASWRTAPHVTLTIDVDMSAATAFRDRLRAALVAEGGDAAAGRLTWNAMIAWVAVQALARQPELNATLDNDVLRRYEDIHLGVAVDTPTGLLVPVIRGTQRLRPFQLAAALADVATKAMEGRLQPSDMTGATFTISNLGGFGIGMFTPILNPPQVAILGIGAVRDQVVPFDGQVAVRPMCTFSLSFDHRAADGADGARYLALLKELLLDPHRLIV